jgi:hypothetical protein
MSVKILANLNGILNCAGRYKVYGEGSDRRLDVVGQVEQLAEEPRPVRIVGRRRHPGQTVALGEMSSIAAVSCITWARRRT